MWFATKGTPEPIEFLILGQISETSLAEMEYQTLGIKYKCGLLEAVFFFGSCS